MSIDPNLFDSAGSIPGVVSALTDLDRRLSAVETARTFIGAGTIEGGPSGQIVASSITATEINTGNLAAETALIGFLSAGSIETKNIVASFANIDKLQTTHIAAQAITANEIAAGTILAGNIHADTITSNEIAASAITTSELAALAVTTAKLDALSVTTAKLDALSVTTAKIAAGAVTANEINAGSVAAATVTATTINSVLSTANTSISDSILSRLVSATNIGAQGLSAITANIGSITSGTVTGATLRTAANGKRVVIDSTGITAYGGTGTTVVLNFDTTTGNLALLGTVTASSSSIIPATTISASGGGLVTGQIQDGTLLGTDIAAGTITANNILADTITANEIASDAITVNELAANAVTAIKISAGSITAGKISVGTLTSVTIPNSNFAEGNPADGTTLANGWTLSGSTIFTVQTDSTWGRVSQVSAPAGSSTASQSVSLPIGRHIIRAWVKTASFTPNARITLTAGTATATLTSSANATGTTGWSLLEAVADVTVAGTVTVALNASASGTGTAQFANVTVETAVTGTSITPNSITTTMLTATAINGMTITGAVLQTASSGARVVVDGASNSVKTYDSGGTQIQQIDGTTGVNFLAPTGGVANKQSVIWTTTLGGTEAASVKAFSASGAAYINSKAITTVLSAQSDAVLTATNFAGHDNYLKVSALSNNGGGTVVARVRNTADTSDLQTTIIDGNGDMSVNTSVKVPNGYLLTGGGTATGAPGDLRVQRVGATTTGAVFLGSAGYYLYFDGTNYNFGGAADVFINGSRAMRTPSSGPSSPGRSLNATYQPSTTRACFVYASLYMGNGGGGINGCHVLMANNSGLVGATNLGYFQLTGNTNNYGSFSFLVPAGWYYQIQTDNTAPSVNNITELLL